MEIKELIVETNNLVETEHFYTRILECSMENKTEDSITFRVGSSKLTFEFINRKFSPIYHFAFNIPSNRLDEAFAWISKRVAIIRNESESYITDFESWKAKSIYFFDNNKNILELISREDLNHFSDTEFDSRSILNISEVGVVTDKPLELGKKIVNQTKSNFFSKGPKRNDFIVVGDETGLLIVSNPHRNWYPTQTKAKKERIKVKLKVAKTEYQFNFN